MRFAPLIMASEADRGHLQIFESILPAAAYIVTTVSRAS